MRSVPDLEDQVGEGGSLPGVVGPAAGHEGVERRGAVLGFGKADPLLQLVDHVPVLQPEERLLTPTQDLPQTHGWG